MRTLELRITTDGSGAGTATAANSRQGFIEAVNIDYAASADAGTDVVISCVEGPGQDLTILTVSNNKTDGWYYPRVMSHSPAGAAQASYEIKVPFKGYLRLTVAQGGATVTDCVAATIFYSE